jgi:Holliday junction resolvase RusA-like endonuclease
MAGRDQHLAAYQAAIKEALGTNHTKIEGKVKITFYFWRKQEQYTTAQSRRTRSHEADATNMGKATEDALQGVLFENDRDVSDIRNVIVAQGPDVEGRIIMHVEPYIDTDIQNEIPSDVLGITATPLQPIDNSWPPPGS